MFKGMSELQKSATISRLIAVSKNLYFDGSTSSGYDPFDDVIIIGSEVKNREKELDPADFTLDILNHELQHRAQRSGMNDDEAIKTTLVNNIMREHDLASMGERDAMMAQKNPRNSTYYKFLTPKQKRYYDKFIDVNKALEEFKKK